jgi:glycosyltransferase involved in cell wall biosynthesis
MLARALVRRGVEVVCYGDPDLSTADLGGAGFRSIRPLLHSDSRLGNGIEYGSFALAATRQLRRDRERFDIVDVSGTTAWEHDVVRVHAVQKAEEQRWPLRGGRTFRVAWLRSRVAPVTRPKFGIARLIERRQFKPKASRLIMAVTDEVKRDLQAVHGVPADKIEVIPYPVDVERFAKQRDGSVRRALGLESTDILALFVGHDFERKGLAEAIAALVDLDERVRLVVVGRGDQDSYIRLARRAGVAQRVHFVGGTDSPERHFCDADVFVLPTREDVWGIALIEAMAASLPIVTTDAAGAARIVTEAGAGLVLSGRESATLRAALGSLARDSRLRDAMGRRGRAAARRFGIDAYAEAVLAGYWQALGDGEPQTRPKNQASRR